MESCDFYYHLSVKKQDVHSHPLPVEDTWGEAVMRYSSPLSQGGFSGDQWGSWTPTLTQPL